MKNMRIMYEEIDWKSIIIEVTVYTMADLTSEEGRGTFRNSKTNLKQCATCDP